MTDTVAESPTPRKRRSWLKLLGFLLVVGLVLIVAAYFIGTSSGFFKSFILPRVGRSLGADVTVSGASISPFSQVVLHDLKVQTTGSEPLATAREVRARYSLTEIMKGHILVDEVALVSPVITVVQNADGTSNLDPIMKKFQEPSTTTVETKSSQPVQVDLKRATLTDGTVRYVTLYKGGTRDVAELSKINTTVENVKNGGTGKLTLDTDLLMQNNPPAPGAAGALQAHLNGSYEFSLKADLMPAAFNGNARLETTRADGSFAQMTGLKGELSLDATPTEIRQAALRFLKGTTALGHVRASGPLNLETLDGRLQVELSGVDKQLLNLAGAPYGIDFGSSKVSSTNQIELAKSAQVITADGRLDMASFQVIQTNQSTPVMDLRAQYRVTVDLLQSNALLQAFSVAGTQQGKQLLKGELSSPMTVSWGAVSNAVGDSALTLTLTDLNLADWKPFVGKFAPAGQVSGQAKVLSQKAGQQLTFDVSSQVQNLTATFDTNQIAGLGIGLQISGTAADLARFNLTQYRFQLSRQNQQMLTVSGSGKYDLKTGASDLDLQAQAALTPMLQMMPQPEMKVTSGTAEVRAKVVGTKDANTVTGTLTVTNLSGTFGTTELQNYAAAMDLDVVMEPQAVNIRTINGRLASAGQAGGTFGLSGTYSLTNKPSQLTLRLAGLNQNGLRPFLEPMLADKKLTAVDLNGDASVQYDPSGASAIKGSFQIANLTVKDPKGQFPSTPLGAKLAIDASMNKQVAEVRNCQLSLTPTAKATNQVQLTGRVDMSQTNAIQGNLALTADSLDLTSYYDLFMGSNSVQTQAAPSTTPAPSATASSQAAVEKEPEATTFPFRNFSASATVRRVYLRELEIADAQATATIDAGHITLNPFKMTINGAPVTSTVDLQMGVPGYKYDLAFDARAVPLAPFVNSFQPDRKGQLSGTFTAQAKFAGAGITGASLQKNLSGNFDAGSTNLNLAVSNVRSPLLKALINVVTMIPDLAKNPETAVASLLGSLVSKSGTASQGSLSSDLQQSPIDQIVGRGTIASGKMTLENALVRSPAFQAQATGTVALAAILTNSSVNFPVSIALTRPLAERIKMVPANTPTNATYVGLPDFLTIKGTMGSPKTDINKLALAAAVLKGVGGSLSGGDAKTGQIMQNLGSILGGGTSPTTNAASATNQQKGLGGLLQGVLGATNAPATNKSTNQPTGVGGLLQGILGPATNTSRATTNATNQPVGTLLDQLLKPKK